MEKNAWNTLYLIYWPKNAKIKKKAKHVPYVVYEKS